MRRRVEAALTGSAVVRLAPIGLQGEHLIAGTA